MTDPLFIADLATLQAKLRLTGIAADSPALAILDEAILDARGEFYRRLQASRVTALLAIPFVTNPAGGDQITRAIANTTEVKLVKVRLMRDLPLMFMDVSGGKQRAWNEEAPFREAGLGMSEKEIKRLEDSIEENFQLLAAEEKQGAETDWRMSDDSSDFCPPRPGDTTKPANIIPRPSS